MAKAAAIYLAELDLARLENAANRTGNNSPLAGLVSDLIVHTNVVPDNKIPTNVVIMNLAVCVVDDTGAEQERALVYPEKVNMAPAKLSVFSPVGAALLDARADRSVEYSAPNGTQRSLRIDHAVFQPEATGQHTL